MLVKVHDGVFVEAQGIGSINVDSEYQVIVYYPVTDFTFEFACADEEEAYAVANKLGEAIIEATKPQPPYRYATFGMASSGLTGGVTGTLPPTEPTEGESK